MVQGAGDFIRLIGQRGISMTAAGFHGSKAMTVEITFAAPF